MSCDVGEATESLENELQKEQTLLIFPHLPWFGHHEKQSTKLLANEMQHSHIK